MSKSSHNRILADMLADKMQSEPAKSSELDKYFAEQPPPLDTFIRDAKYMNNHGGLSPVQFDFVHHIEGIYPEHYYPTIVKEWGAEYMPPRFVNDVVGAWGKGCLLPYSEVFDASTGVWRTVSSLKDAPGRVVGVDLAGEIPTLVREDRSESFYHGRGECFRVTTSLGNEIDVYAGHKFLTWESTPKSPISGWHQTVKPVYRRLSEMRVGDRVAAPTHLSIDNPVPQNLHEVELIGFWLGDGCLPTDDRAVLNMDFSDAEPLAMRLYEEAVASITGETIHLSVKHKTKKMFYHRTSHPKIHEVVRKYGLWGKKASDKRVPEAIFSLPDDQLSIFMSRLWGTDGTVYSKKYRGGSHPVAQYTTISRGLAYDVQRLLLRLGVVSRVTSRVPSYTYQGEKRLGQRAYTVSTIASSYVKFCEKVPLLDKGPKQISVLRELENRAYVRDYSNGDIYWDRIVAIEPIGEHDYWNLTAHSTRSYVAEGLLHANSGKDFAVQLSFARVVNLLLCLRSPQDFYGVPHQTIIHLLNVAASSKQAHGVFFKPLRSLIVASPWFMDKFEGDPPGPQSGEMHFKKQIELISGHSDAETLEGKNLLVAVADEISAFASLQTLTSRTAPSKTAEGLVGMLKSSAVTRFPMEHKIVQISYPRAKGDAILTAVKTGNDDVAKNGDLSRYYVSGPYATWDVNPRFFHIEKVEVPGSDVPIPNLPTFVNEYEKNPANARGKYECKPEAAMNRFFKDDAAIYGSFDKRLTVPPITFSYRVGRDEAEGGSVEQWQCDFFLNDLQPKPGALYSVHGDLAVTGDRAGVAVSHVSKWDEHDESSTGIVESRPHVVVDFVGGWEADKNAVNPETGKSLPREIQIRWFRKFVLWLKAQGFNIASVSNDGFQSTDGLQILESQGFDTRRISLDRNQVGYKNLKDLMYEGRLHGYYHEDLIHELQGLNQFRNGKIDHLPGNSKDYADGVAGSVMGAVIVGGREETSEDYEDGAESILSSGTDFSASGVLSGWAANPPATFSAFGSTFQSL